MPNIMLTSKCNLKCCYCFANNVVNQPTTSDISLDNFSTAINFITSSGKTRLGLIGGEPTLHKDFKEILNIAIDNDLIEIVTVCTNGIELENYYDILDHPKVQVLFNYNMFPNITASQQQRVDANIKRYFSNINNIGNIGINIYNNDVDCKYVFNLAKNYNQKVIRISLTVPPIDICNTTNYFDYLNSRKSKLLELIDLAKQYDIQFSFDCDIPPMCELFLNNYFPRNLNVSSGCTPIIDITPELEAFRCFGTSHLCRVKITDFPNINSLREYFISKIDKPASEIIVRKRCTTCAKRQNLQCSSGCIRFKTNML